jgi:hypothetical protein
VLGGAAVVACGLLVGWIVSLSHEPVDGTDAVGMTMMSAFFLAVLAGLAAVVLLACALWLHLYNRRSPAPVPAGWYADPESPSSLRYWDGRLWTQHTA